jgi:hypothetical protein
LPTVVQEGRIGLARQQPVAVHHQDEFGVQVLPRRGVAVVVGVPGGEHAVGVAAVVVGGVPEIMRAGAQSRGAVGAVGPDAIAELPDRLLVDVGPIEEKGPRTVKTNVGSSVEGVNVALQVAEKRLVRVLVRLA